VEELKAKPSAKPFADSEEDGEKKEKNEEEVVNAQDQRDGKKMGIMKGAAKRER
jgi:hypothetical protein